MVVMDLQSGGDGPAIWERWSGGCDRTNSMSSSTVCEQE